MGAFPPNVESKSFAGADDFSWRANDEGFFEGSSPGVSATTFFFLPVHTYTVLGIQLMRVAKKKLVDTVAKKAERSCLQVLHTATWGKIELEDFRTF